MRFIAVFNQLQASYGMGFDNLLDAIDFLFWGYEDQELVPQGVYDQLTDQTMPYEHAGRRVDAAGSSTSIRDTAKEYLKNLHPLVYMVRTSAG